jgi:hypothetical protein
LHSTRILKIFSITFNAAVASSHLSTPSFFAIVFVVSKFYLEFSKLHKNFISGTYEQEQPSINISSNSISCKLD